MSLERILDVALSALTLEALLTSVMSGLAFGFLVFGMSLSELARLTDVERSSRYIRGSVLATLLLGWVFFAPTLVTSIFAEDNQWPRIAVRLGMWAVFSGTLGVGMWIRIRVDAWVTGRRLRNPTYHEGS